MKYFAAGMLQSYYTALLKSPFRIDGRLINIKVMPTLPEANSATHRHVKFLLFTA